MGGPVRPVRGAAVTSPKGADTQKRILDAARTLLAEGRSQRFTTRQVASLAGISHGQCHYHFATKRDLVLALIEDARRDWVAPLEALIARTSSADERMRRVISWMAEPATGEVMRVHQSLYGLALDDDAIRETLAHEYAAWRSAFARLFGDLADEMGLVDFDAQAVGWAFASAADGLVQQQTLDPELPTERLLTALYDHLVA